jgi:hypothetical protein
MRLAWGEPDAGEKFADLIGPRIDFGERAGDFEKPRTVRVGEHRREHAIGRSRWNGDGLSMRCDFFGNVVGVDLIRLTTADRAETESDYVATENANHHGFVT